MPEVEIATELKDLIPGFLDRKKSEIETLKTCLDERNYQAIAKIAHDIKGTSGGYGFDRMSELAEDLEAASEKQDRDSLKQLIEKLESYLNSITIRWVD